MSRFEGELRGDERFNTSGTVTTYRNPNADKLLPITTKPLKVDQRPIIEPQRADGTYPDRNRSTADKCPRRATGLHNWLPNGKRPSGVPIVKCKWCKRVANDV